MSGESDERDLDPNATIQLDALDGVQLDESDPPLETENQAGVARAAPPVLAPPPDQCVDRGDDAGPHRGYAAA